jgi:hypothetical protein
VPASRTSRRPDGSESAARPAARSTALLRVTPNPALRDPKALRPTETSMQHVGLVATRHPGPYGVDYGFACPYRVTLLVRCARSQCRGRQVRDVGQLLALLGREATPRATPRSWSTPSIEWPGARSEKRGAVRTSESVSASVRSRMEGRHQPGMLKASVVGPWAPCVGPWALRKSRAPAQAWGRCMEGNKRVAKTCGVGRRASVGSDVHRPGDGHGSDELNRTGFRGA